MKVGNMVKWHTDTAHFSLVSCIVIDNCMIDGLHHATVFWFASGAEHHHPYMDLTIISRA